MIIGFSGKAQVGKTTAAEVLAIESDFRRMSFATGVKEECIAFLTKYDVVFSVDNFYGTLADKEMLLNIERVVDAVVEVPEFLGFVHMHTRKDLNKKSFTFTPRALMQWWGTDYRRAQDPLYWVNRALDRAVMLSLEGFDIAIDDVRFPIEADMILGEGGEVYRITRPDRPTIDGAEHESETALDTYTDFSGDIVNVGTLDEFATKVREVVK